MQVLRLLETFRLEEVEGAVGDALRLGAIGFDFSWATGPAPPARRTTARPCAAPICYPEGRVCLPGNPAI